MAEAAIGEVLLQQWDPLAVHDMPGVHAEYLTHAHEIYDMLARGGSDVQIERYLRHIERDDMHHPEGSTRNLRAVLDALRKIERTVI